MSEAILSALGREGSTLTVVLVRDPVMRALNQQYRGKDYATDVLSFPAGEQANAERARFIGDPDYLGDVVVSADTARAHATTAGHTFEREIDELVMHGVLHLCGYDHETDCGEMNRLELKLRRRLLNK